MTPKVLVARDHWSIGAVTEFLVENSISGAPVVSDDERLLGVVSVTDIVRQGPPGCEQPDSGYAHDYYRNALESSYAHEELSGMHLESESMVTVRDIMTPLVFEVAEEASVQDVAETMVRGHIHRVFVTSAGKITGVITALDMLKVVRDM